MVLAGLMAASASERRAAVCGDAHGFTAAVARGASWSSELDLARGTSTGL